MFWGKNPWQSHGIQQARRILKEFANDPARTLIVVDPRRTESADLADIHLRPLPGGDAHLLAAMLAILVQDGLLADAWLAEHANGLDELVAHLRTIDIAESCAKAGVDEADVRRAAHAIGNATGGVSVLEDLGIQMAPHSTLNSYLEKLLVLLTGNLGVPGGVNIHSHFVALLGGGADSRGKTTPVTGHRLVTGLVPCNVIPDEILTDHPDRFRAMLVESGNPVHSLVRQPPDARGDARPRPRRRDRRGAHRDGTRGRLRAARRVAVREVGVHVLQPRVPAQRVPPAPAAVRAGSRARCPSTRSTPAVPRARRVRRLGRRAAAGRRRESAGRRSPRRSSRSSAPGRSSGGWRAC